MASSGFYGYEMLELEQGAQGLAARGQRPAYLSEMVQANGKSEDACGIHGGDLAPPGHESN